MKYSIAFALLLLPVLASPSAAGEGDLSRSTLAALGLDSMEFLSDADGLEVRGLSAQAATRGTSLVAGLVVDPATSSFLGGTDTDLAASTTEGSTGLDVAQAHASALELVLEVGTGSSAFLGVVVGGAGGYSRASN